MLPKLIESPVLLALGALFLILGGSNLLLGDFLRRIFFTPVLFPPSLLAYSFVDNG